MPSHAPSLAGGPALAGAVDLSALAHNSPAPAAAAQGTPAGAEPDEQMPREFTLSIVGGADDLVYVLLGFGHLRWQFTPAMADDLGSALLDAARQARLTGPDGRPNGPVSAS